MIVGIGTVTPERGSVFFQTAALVLQLYFWNCTPFVVIILGHTLMPAAPRRPLENVANRLSYGQHETPQEAANLGDTQRYRSPREALNAVKLLGRASGGVLFGISLRGR